MNKLTAYIHYRASFYGPFQTVGVEIKETKTPINKSRTGYGNRLPTQYMIKVENKWRRVYAVCYSNVATTYIGPVKDKVVVRIDNF